ncbi:MAG: hypothetical protein AABY97_03115 [Chloroflexota bacterium]
MAGNQLPTMRHVLPLTTIRLERKLPGPGTVTVRIREKVQPADVVAEVQPPTKHYFLDLAAGLGTSEAEVSRYMRVELGSNVEAGQVIAGPVGIARRTMRAPANGRLLTLSRGRALFEASEEPYQIHAGVSGVVVASDGTSSLTIETTGALIQGAWGNGRRGWGVMRVIGQGPSDRLLTDQLDINLRGAVLLAGVCDNAAPLHQATELAVRGLVLGSMTAELIPIALRVAYPILLMEGFGTAPMNRVAYELLNSNAGREASLEATLREPYGRQMPEVIIPLPTSSRISSPERVIQFAPGVRVRCMRAPHTGAVGKIRHLIPKAEAFPSGIFARSALVDLEEIGSVPVPLSNLEVLA